MHASVKVTAHGVYMIGVYNNLVGNCGFYVRDELDMFCVCGHIQVDD